MCKSSANPVQTLLKSTWPVHNLCAKPGWPHSRHVAKWSFSARNPQLQTPYFSTAWISALSVLAQPLSTASTGPITKKTI